MAIDRSQFITRSPLEDFSIRHMNDQTDFISDEVAVPFLVSKSSFKKYQYDRSNLKSVDTRKDSKAEADSVDYGVFTTDVTAVLHKLKGDVDPRDERDADAAVADMETDVAATITEKLLLKREIDLATLVSTSGSYPSGLTSTLGAGATWAVSGGDPVSDANLARAAVRDSCGKPANALAISWKTFEYLKVHPVSIDRLKYTEGKTPTEDAIKNLMGLEYLHVCKAQKNTGDEGAADVIADVWGDFALFYVKNPAQGRRTMQYMRNFMVNRLYTHRYEDDRRGSGAGRVKVLEMGMEYVLSAAAVVSSADSDFAAGYLLANVY